MDRHRHSRPGFDQPGKNRDGFENAKKSRLHLYSFCFKVIWGVILAVNNYQVILFTSNYQENLLHQGALLVPVRAHLCEECMRLLSLLSREQRHLVRHQLVTVSGDYLCATAGYIFC